MNGRPYQHVILEALKSHGHIVEFLCEDESNFCNPPWLLTFKSPVLRKTVFYKTSRLDKLQEMLVDTPPEDAPLLLVGLQEVLEDDPHASTELCISSNVHKYLLARGGSWDRVHLYLLIATTRLRLEGVL